MALSHEQRENLENLVGRTNNSNTNDNTGCGGVFFLFPIIWLVWAIICKLIVASHVNQKTYDIILYGGIVVISYLLYQQLNKK